MRRRWAWAILLLFCLTAAGCRQGEAKRQNRRPITSGFSCTVSAEYAGMAIDGTLTRETGGALTLAVTKPPTLCGASLTLSGEALTVAIGGMKLTVDPGRYPKAGALPVLLSALDTVAAMTDGGEKTAGGLRLTGETDDGCFTLLSDPKTGNLLSLSLPDVPLTVIFSDFRQIISAPTD